MPSDTRKYPIPDLKVLVALSAGYCAFPGCKQRCISLATEQDPTVFVGTIAHIWAHSENGPRANLLLSPRERDCYQNWILLCGHHHTVVDNQPNTYTPNDLKSWKTDLESWVAQKLTMAMPSIGFPELEVIANALLSAPAEPTQDLTLIPPNEKIRKNGLSARVTQRLMLGLVKAAEVRDFIEKMEGIAPSYTEKLKEGFVSAYLNFKNNNRLSGDALFWALQEFAFGPNADFDRQAAGLAILTYLFEKCEVFEK